MDKSLRNELLDIGEKLFSAGRASVVKYVSRRHNVDISALVGGDCKGGKKRGRPHAGVSKKVLKYLMDHKDKKFTTPEVTDAIKCNKLSVTGALFRLFKDKKINKPERGYWQGK